jgi:hypothetical protein
MSSSEQIKLILILKLIFSKPEGTRRTERTKMKWLESSENLQIFENHVQEEMVLGRSQQRDIIKDIKIYTRC